MPSPRRKISLKPRKKPSQSRAAETVAAILEAAARILERGGLPAYNTNAVAERAGVSIGSLYQYFPNKDALTAALIDRETATLLADLAAVPNHASYADGVVALVRAAIAHQLHRPALARLLDFEERRLPMRDRDLQVDRAAQACVLGLLRRPDAPAVAGDGATSAELLALDAIAIVRSLVDAAGERGETEAAPLQRRVLHAVFGYLGQPRAAEATAKTRKRTESLRPAG
ncbi:TetR/AcrR family transcriptional regulator [Lysobacter sp. 1R34A]|uniref:TetR/AcrR family transcriptional regulator n=1 Tax=Lysobacter sp. 1R34A TaxID=3445786 RepID=UPI003EE979BD